MLHGFDEDQVEPAATAARWPSTGWAWAALMLLVLVAAGWFWITSVPGPFPLVLLPFLACFVAAGLTAGWFVVRWIASRRRGVGRSTPWLALAAIGVLAVVVVGSMLDLGVRIRFELYRERLTTLATTPSLGPATPDMSTGLLMEVDGYGSVTVMAVSGGTMVITGGHPVAHGFVYLPDTHAVIAWPGPTELEPLGGDWYLTV